MYNNNYYQPPRNLGIQTNYQQPIYQPMYQVPISQPTSSGLQGKIVDSIETAKNQDIQLDGSISYFALTDGTAIVSKQLQADGTSKTTIYRPISEEQVELPKYATLDDIKKEINNIDLSEIDDLKEEIRELKKQLKDLKKKGD